MIGQFGGECILYRNRLKMYRNLPKVLGLGSCGVRVADESCRTLKVDWCHSRESVVAKITHYLYMFDFSYFF